MEEENIGEHMERNQNRFGRRGFTGVSPSSTSIANYGNSMMSRGTFMRGLGLAGAGVAAGMMGFGGTVHADAPDTGGYIVPNTPNAASYEIYPTGNAPPFGSIVAVPKSSLLNGRAFSINDNSAPGRLPVRFYMKVTSSYTEGTVPGYSANIAINISSTSISTAAQVASTIANAINGVTTQLYVNAFADGYFLADVSLYYDYLSDILSNGNAVVLQNISFPGTINTWTSYGLHNDVQHIQWAVNNVSSGGTVTLMGTLKDGITPQSFNFGPPSPLSRGGCYRVNITKDVEIIGLSGATINGGNYTFYCAPATMPPSGHWPILKIRSITFTNFVNRAIVVGKSSGLEISGCTFTTSDLSGGANILTISTSAGGGQNPSNFTGAVIVEDNVITAQPNVPGTVVGGISIQRISADVYIRRNQVYGVTAAVGDDAVSGKVYIEDNIFQTGFWDNTVPPATAYPTFASIAIGSFLNSYANCGYCVDDRHINRNQITANDPKNCGIWFSPVLVKPGAVFDITGNQISLSGTLNTQSGIKLSGSASNCVVSGNTISGNMRNGILLDPLGHIFTFTGNVQNNLVYGNDLSSALASEAQIKIMPNSNGNYFGPDDENGIPANVIGPISASGIAGIIDNGYNNSFVMNDFTLSDIKGKKFGPPYQVCVLLNTTSHDDFVFQSGTFPPGTGGAKDQVSDLGTDNSNRVVGLPANHLASTVDRGIGQRLQTLEAQLAAQQVQADPSALGYAWDDVQGCWVDPDGNCVQ